MTRRPPERTTSTEGGEADPPLGDRSAGRESHARVRASFGPNAARYSTSTVHATAGIARLVALAEPSANDRVLDVATGGGHVALAFAAAGTRTVALDVTPEMLEEVRRNVEARRLPDVARVLGAAEALPFATASFDVVACRLATHHFHALPAALADMARVLVPGGRLLIADTTVPEDDTLDDAINHIEILRDPSHVRNHRPSEWRALAERAGLRVTLLEPGYDDGDGMSFDDWTSRVRTPPDRVAELRRLLRTASAPLRDALHVRTDGDDFRIALPRVSVVATKPVRP